MATLKKVLIVKLRSLNFVFIFVFQTEELKIF